MTYQLADRVKESTATTGTGVISLAGALTGYQAFSSFLNNGDQTLYALQSVDGVGNPTGAWEIGLGTYTTSGNTLSRSVITSSNSNALVSLTGTTYIWCDQPAASAMDISGKNRIINGTCDIAQRTSAAVSFATGVSGYGGPDRYFAINANSAGGTFTQSQSTITWNGIARNCVKQNVSTAISSTTTTNYWGGICQRIEGFNCFDLLGGTACLQFVFLTNVTGTYSVAIQDGTSANSFVQTFSATSGTPVQVIIPIASISTSLGISLNTSLGLQVNIGAINTGTYQTSTTGSWQAGQYFTASGSTNWGTAINNYISTTLIQLEDGPVPTTFEQRPYATEFNLCLRYYNRISYSASNYAKTLGPVFGVNTTTLMSSTQLPVAMRAAPTVSVTGISSLAWGNLISANAVPSAVTADAADLSVITLKWTGTSVVTGNTYFLQRANGATPVPTVECSAEL